MTRTNSQAAVAQSLKETVCKWLGWSELEYGQFQYDQGLAYLRHYLPGDRWSHGLLERKRLFWAWWKNHWSARDASFCDIETGHPRMSRTNLTIIYKALHDGGTLASDIYPGRIVLEDSYSEMICSLIKEESNAEDLTV
jgi:hypothetical protein